MDTNNASTFYCHTCRRLYYEPASHIHAEHDTTTAAHNPPWKAAAEFRLSLDELTMLHLALKQLNRYDRAKDKELALELALRLHSFLASERTRRSEEYRG